MDRHTDAEGQTDRRTETETHEETDRERVAERLLGLFRPIIYL